MKPSDEVLDLDYESSLESLFGFLGSALCMGISTLAVWYFLVSPGKHGSPAIWVDFPIIPFALGMLCLWALGHWLNTNYDVRYQLNSKTQQLDLVRSIFGQTFKSRVATFSQLHSTAVLSTWSDDKQWNRTWQYALSLVTRSARIVRVSSFSSISQNHQAAEIAKKVGIAHFPCQEKSGTLVARRRRDGTIILGYRPPQWWTNGLVQIGLLVVAIPAVTALVLWLATLL